MSQSIPNFDALGLAAPLMQAIDDTGYSEPTPIQSKAIPLVLTGGDLLAAAQTGTGKTAGFTLPILHQLLKDPSVRPKPGRPRTLILTPTRELAAQIGASVQVYGKHTSVRSAVVFGGVNIGRQIRALRKPIELLIATPGRLLDLIDRGILHLSSIEILVLDEADRMLDMGFIHDVRRVTKLIPKHRQTLLFSATFSDQIRTLARTLLKSPVEVSVTPKNTATDLVKQSAHYVDKRNKPALISHLISSGNWKQVLVFTKTKHGANRLAEHLGKDGIKADAIHGNKSQSARTKALENFKNGKVTVLVATDIAARGIDIHQLPQVVNFELPLVAEDYVHRIGRTGRAGSNGQAVSLVDIDELKLMNAIERLIKQDIPVLDVEGYTGHTDLPSNKSQRARQRTSSRSNAEGSKKKRSNNKRSGGSSWPSEKKAGGQSAKGRVKKQKRRRKPKASVNKI